MERGSIDQSTVEDEVEKGDEPARVSLSKKAGSEGIDVSFEKRPERRGGKD
jgi:hypothetical protein